MFGKYIAKGIEFLDRIRPGWDNRVDLDKLDLAESCRCVLGQVFCDRTEKHDNGFSYARRELLWKEGVDAEDCGFDVPDRSSPSPENYRQLDEEWIAAIRQRQAQPKPTITPAQPAERPAAHVALTAVCLR